MAGSDVCEFRDAVMSKMPRSGSFRDHVSVGRRSLEYIYRSLNLTQGDPMFKAQAPGGSHLTNLKHSSAKTRFTL